MAGKSGHTFKWKIENASFCWMKLAQNLKSPTWVVEELDCTGWFLKLYPRLNRDFNIICLGIERDRLDGGPESIAVHFQLAFLDKHGNVAENVVRSYEFRAGTYIGSCYAAREVIFSGKESEYLCNDALTVVCRLKKRDDVFFETAFTIARTTIKVEKRSGVLVIEDFANKLRNKHAKIDVSYGGNKFVRAAFFLTGDSHETCNFELEYLNRNLKYVFMKTYILNADHKSINCGESEEFGDGERKISCFTLPVNKNFLTAKENNFLRKGALYFHFQCSYTTGIAFNEIEEAGVAYIPSSFEDHIASSDDNSTVQLFSSSLKDDLIPYDSCDAEIHTADRKFVAHKDILIANSSVFRDFFECDVSIEERSVVECFQVDSETMCRMLNFIYTGTLEDLQWNTASQLYDAACEFDVPGLKRECSSFLKNNICSHASELLVIADKHGDENLKSFLQTYIAANKNGIYFEYKQETS